ncbi:MAG: hypothetical protein ACFFCS_29125, partial [Candidatus Hodarchaeota archaeon]
IGSTGVWLSREEVFSVVAATSAIYNACLTLHTYGLKYMVIDGETAKIMIIPLQENGSIGDKISDPNYEEYFLAITTLSYVNLQSIYVRIKSTMKNLFQILLKSGKSFKPPLREFNEKQVNDILENYNSKEQMNADFSVQSPSYKLSSQTQTGCNRVLLNFKNSVPDLVYSSVSFKGGFVLTHIMPSERFNLSAEFETAMSYSIYDTAARCAWLLKKMDIKSIFLDCDYYLHYIMGFDGGIFSTYILKNGQRIGFIRMLVPKYLELITNVLNETQSISPVACAPMEGNFSVLNIR